MSRQIECQILTPEKPLYTGSVDFVVVKAYDGEVGFLFNHAPFISMLGIGEVRLRTKTSTDYVYIENGIVEIKDNKLHIIAEKAVKKGDLDAKVLQDKMSELSKQLPGLAQYSKDREAVKFEIEVTKEKIKVASK